MRKFADLFITHKLRAIIVFSAAVVSLIASTLHVVSEIVSYRFGKQPWRISLHWVKSSAATALLRRSAWRLTL